MSLNFAAISPHPPIIVPEIGTPEDLSKSSSTVFAMKKLATLFNAAEIDTLIVISPHGLIYPDRFNICGMHRLFGSFASFDHPDKIYEAENDLEFVDALSKKLDENNIPFTEYDNNGEFYELDHGVMVPLSYLKSQQESKFKVVPIAYSNLDRARHFEFGRTLQEAAREFPGRVGILASGDLSHQLLQNHEGKIFDERLVKDIKTDNVEEIMVYDEEEVEKIGECGYRSILILLGVLDNIDTETEVLSYEGPFGVGYLVANFGLPEV